MTQLDKELIIKEEELLSEDDSHEVPPNDIVAFNELRSCADILRMHKSKQLVIKPDFQRDMVWSNPSKTRFIDSLIKQLPIPSMCISFDYKTNERLVIDGLQRINSIISFLGDEDWRLSKLKDIDQKISGKTILHIKQKFDNIYNRVENLAIPITVLRCDYSKKNHKQYLFTIFHRLNTGGNKLKNQEIRNCIYSGSFNEMLKDMVQYPNFRKLFGLVKGKSYRYAYEELVLRVFAFSIRLEKYKGGLANFLNDYMDDHRDLKESELTLIRQRLERTIDLIYLRILAKKKLAKIGKTTSEAILIGVIQNIDDLENEEDQSLKHRFDNLLNDNEFTTESLKEGLSAKEKVQIRLNRAIEIFA